MTTSPESLRQDIDEIKSQLNEIQRIVTKLAVQDERIKHVELSVGALWEKHDKRCEQIDSVIRHQAGCPKDQLRWIWIVLIPQGLALLGMLLSMFAQMFHGNK